jgi:hypothetical protein
MTNYKESQEIEESYEVSVVLMPTYINGLKEAAIVFNASHEEYLLALGDLAQGIYQFVNTGEIPNFTTALAKITFKHSKKCIIQSAEKFKKNIKNSRKGAETKKAKAEKLNTVKPEATEVEDNQPITNSDTVKTRQLQKTQQPHKPQQVQKEQQLDWQCVAGLELTEKQQQEAIRIRKANNPGNSKEAKKIQTFTPASLKQFLGQVKHSIDAGITVDEVLEVWEGKQWRSWTHAYYAKEIASDIKAQSQTAKDLKSVKFNEAKRKNNDWENINLDGEDLTGVMAILEGGELERQNPLHKELEKKYEK